MLPESLCLQRQPGKNPCGTAPCPCDIWVQSWNENSGVRVCRDLVTSFLETFGMETRDFTHTHFTQRDSIDLLSHQVLQALVLLKTIVRQGHVLGVLVFVCFTPHSLLAAKSFSQAADRDYAAIVPGCHSHTQ